MGNKRFETLFDCFRHGTDAVVECQACGHWIPLTMVTLLKMDGIEPSFPFWRAERRFRCSKCGQKRSRVYPGTRPHEWKGNR